MPALLYWERFMFGERSRPALFAGIRTPAGAGLAHHNPAQQGKRWMQASPDPAREVFAGRVLQTIHIVQATMVDLVMDPLERTLDLGKVHHPSEALIQGAGNMNLDVEAVPVKASALVPFRHIRQPMRRFDREFLEYLHGCLYGIPTILCVCRLRRHCG